MTYLDTKLVYDRETIFTFENKWIITNYNHINEKKNHDVDDAIL